MGTAGKGGGAGEEGRRREKKGNGDGWGMGKRDAQRGEERRRDAVAERRKSGSTGRSTRSKQCVSGRRMTSGRSKHQMRRGQEAQRGDIAADTPMARFPLQAEEARVCSRGSRIRYERLQRHERRHQATHEVPHRCNTSRWTQGSCVTVSDGAERQPTTKQGAMSDDASHAPPIMRPQCGYAKDTPNTCS